jgi:hypothetical protein
MILIEWEPASRCRNYPQGQRGKLRQRLQCPTGLLPLGHSSSELSPACGLRPKDQYGVHSIVEVLAGPCHLFHSHGLKSC